MSNVKGKYMHVGPGKSMSGEMPINLRDGFTVMAGLRITARDVDGQQTIFLFEGAEREIAELFVERDGRIVFGAGLASVSIPPEVAKRYLDHWAVFLIACMVVDDHIVLELECNGERFSNRQPFSGDSEVKRWIQGGGVAEFGLRLVTIFNGLANEETRSKMRNAIQELFE